MASASASADIPQSNTTVDDATYRRRINAWALYDWANSAFVTTILAAVLPTYFNEVAGANLPSAAVATGYWSLTISISLFIAAIISPILGTISDIKRGKKAFLSVFAAIGIVMTGLLVLVDTGDWVLASILVIIARIGFTGSIVFYDALLPHVAKEEDQDWVSARGYAMGYLGGGILLAINVAMIFMMEGTAGVKLSFLSVAVWWLVFSIPLLREVPEPPAAGEKLKAGESVIGASIGRLRETLRDIGRYRELLRYLIAFLIYNDAIGTIIGMAVIYGAELGFDTTELILALMLVQFVGMPFSLIFGSLSNPQQKRRPYFLAFIVFNLVALPLVGITLSRVLPSNISGARVPSYQNTATHFGTGSYAADSNAIVLTGDWTRETISASETGSDRDTLYLTTDDVQARYDFPFNGEQVDLAYTTGPDYGMFDIRLDGKAYLDEEGNPVRIDAYHETVRYGEQLEIVLPEGVEPGEHTVSLLNTANSNNEATGNKMAVGPLRVADAARENSLMLIMGALLAVQAVGAVFALLTGRMFTGLANTLDSKRGIMLALIIYSAIAVWGFFVDSTVEFWFFAWMVATVQGGSQALSRSLFSVMSPALKSGEFFSLYGVMEKFSSILGPLMFTLAVVVFGNSRPAILSLIAFFIIGGWLLMGVNVEEGTRVAKEEDALLMKQAEG